MGEFTGQPSWEVPGKINWWQLSIGGGEKKVVTEKRRGEKRHRHTVGLVNSGAKKAITPRRSCHAMLFQHLSLSLSLRWFVLTDNLAICGNIDDLDELVDTALQQFLDCLNKFKKIVSRLLTVF